MIKEAMFGVPRVFMEGVFAVALSGSVFGCGDDAKVAAAGGTARYVLVSNLEKSAFVGAWNGARPGAYTNANAFEVGLYGYLFTDGTNVIVPQNGASDDILRFTAQSNGNLLPGGKLTAPPQSNPSAVVFAAPDKAYLSCTDAGKVLVFNPSTMALLRTIDFTGPRYALSEAGAGDLNPDPGALGIREGKLYVALAQKNTKVTSLPGMAVAVVDTTTDVIEGTFTDGRGLAETGGEIDRIYLDESGDLYVYGGGSYGFAPGQSHGFLRVKHGEAAFDPAYLFDIGGMSFDVPGGKLDYLNHLVYAGHGIAYAAADAPGLASNPPDYANDHTFQVVKVDLYGKTVELLSLPRSNGYSGVLAVEGGILLAALGAKEGVGIFTYDLASKVGSSAPVVTTEGFVSQFAALK